MAKSFKYSFINIYNFIFLFYTIIVCYSPAVSDQLTVIYNRRLQLILTVCLCSSFFPQHTLHCWVGMDVSSRSACWIAFVVVGVWAWVVERFFSNEWYCWSYLLFSAILQLFGLFIAFCVTITFPNTKDLKTIVFELLRICSYYLNHTNK